ncbi:MAG: acetyl-CoA C-acyltransferase [Paracoccaceae bacterium]|nr:acetyl-CoA C-acyltransferase [Paracoccaceae bacterium]
MIEPVIIGAARTPMGAFQGAFAKLSATELGGFAIRAAVENAEIQSNQVEELFMGCVLPAGLRQAPARQAGIRAGLPDFVPATTVNKVCGSGMKTVLMAVDQILSGNSNFIVAGGMESMSNAPYLSQSSRRGTRIGHSRLEDHMFIDGLEDAFQTEKLMGHFAEECAEKYQFTRKDQDVYAIQSLERASSALKEKEFSSEITPVPVMVKGNEELVFEDEQPKLANKEKIPFLMPAFKVDGSVTAANSSSISDGAAALVVCDEKSAKDRGVSVRARIVGHAGHAQEANWFTTAPIFAVQKLLSKVGWSKDDVDLWEVNEAFAVVPMAFMRDMKISKDRLNIRGGACALGHPIGASGTRIVVTLLNALEDRNEKKGIAAICLGGGEALAIAIERA